jgi:hypothetical protein
LLFDIVPKPSKGWSWKFSVFSPVAPGGQHGKRKDSDFVWVLVRCLRFKRVEDENDDEDEGRSGGVKWLAGVWCGRCGLVARVPQDRMLSRSVTLNKLDGKLLRGK